MAPVEGKGLCVFLQRPQMIRMELPDRIFQQRFANPPPLEKGVNIDFAELASIHLDKSPDDPIIVDIQIFKDCWLLKIAVRQRDYLQLVKGKTFIPEDRKEVYSVIENIYFSHPRQIACCRPSDTHFVIAPFSIR